MTNRSGAAPDTVRPEISMPVYSLATAKRYIDGLVAAGLQYHLEDNPADIVRAGTGEATFTPTECRFLRRRVQTMYALSWDEYRCPIGYMMAAESRLEVRRHLASCSVNDAARDRAMSMDYMSWRLNGFSPRHRVDLETRVAEILSRAAQR